MGIMMPILDEHVVGICNYMNERESIRRLKDQGGPKPWTADPIFQQNKFTNVLRADDKTSRWVVDNWYRPNKDAPNRIKLINAAIFRLFGTIETGEELGYSHTWGEDRIKAVRSIIWGRFSKGHKTFTSAYIITNGGQAMPKITYVIDVCWKSFWRNIEKMEKAIETGKWQDLMTVVRSCEGLGGSGFVAKEVISDAILAGIYGWNEDHNIGELPTDAFTWSPIGPGARRGLNRACGRDAKFKQTELLYLKEMRELYDKVSESNLLFMDTPRPYDKLDLHGMQFNLCEYDKYLRVKTGEGRMKSSYPGARR